MKILARETRRKREKKDKVFRVLSRHFAGKFF